MSILKKILFFITLFALYVIVKEAVTLYRFMYSIHPLLGYGSMLIMAAVVGYFIILPLTQIIRMPRNYSPTKNKESVPSLIEKRMRRLRTNPALCRMQYDFNDIKNDQDGYDAVMKALQPEAERIRRRYVIQMFYSTAVAQNGFLDAILILSISIQLVKELFLLYHGRVSNKDLWAIARRVYVSMAVGGSEGVEYAVDELFSKVTAGGVKSIPFASKILGSVADGFVNAALLTRISIITENYCRLVYIQSEKELYPSYRSVVSATKIITSDIIERIFNELKGLAKDTGSRYVLMTVNPVGYLMGSVMAKKAESSEKMSNWQKEIMLETSALARNPIGYGIGKVADLFRKRRKTTYEDWLGEETGRP